MVRLLDADGGEVLGCHAGDGRHVVASCPEQVEVLLAVDLSLNSKNEKYRGCKVLTLYFSKGMLNARHIIKTNEQKGLTLTVPVPIRLVGGNSVVDLWLFVYFLRGHDNRVRGCSLLCSLGLDRKTILSEI
jgi:hypothetical protein